MDEEIFQDYKRRALFLRQRRFKLSIEPSLCEISHFLEIENAVEKFFFEISVSGGAEADNILILQNAVGGPCQKSEMQRAFSIKENMTKKLTENDVQLLDNNPKV